jgi:hypothetical protein
MNTNEVVNLLGGRGKLHTLELPKQDMLPDGYFVYDIMMEVLNKDPEGNYFGMSYVMDNNRLGFISWHNSQPQHVVSREGKYVTRWSKWWAQRGHPVPQEMVSRFGETLRRKLPLHFSNKDKTLTIQYAIDNSFDWPVGHFGNNGSSCYWTRGAEHRSYLRESGGVAFLVWSINGNTNNDTGHGRVFMVDGKYYKNCVLFNGYGQISTYMVAQIICGLDENLKYVGVEAASTNGRYFVNSNTGVMILGKDETPPYDQVTLRAVPLDDDYDFKDFMYYRGYDDEEYRPVWLT